ncbi:PHP domain-containing protein [Microbacterium sp. MEC084]|uniref:PHP domain-containing protein n=1 Tax=Microbacterium sp. MEC084 TaxID=1963027 RepID=UPI00197BF9AD|nr:PHP domain-containing protein [Microbacterium sp. MEC084]
MPDPILPTHLPRWADPAIPEASLDAQGASRRSFLRGVGMAAGLALASTVLPLAAPAAAASARRGDPELAWLVGDHHVHSRYSHDAKYDFDQLARKGAEYGLDWMAFTEHSNHGNAAKGAAAEHAEIMAARARNPRQLIFQGLEWYIPAAEHGTVLVAPGRNEVELLREFQRRWDGKLNGWAADLPENEARAVAALQWLGEQRAASFVDDVLVLANHPSRLGIDSPHEIRAWRDAADGICVGMEGAPGASRSPPAPTTTARSGTRGATATCPPARASTPSAGSRARPTPAFRSPAATSGRASSAGRTSASRATGTSRSWMPCVAGASGSITATSWTRSTSASSPRATADPGSRWAGASPPRGASGSSSASPSAPPAGRTRRASCRSSGTST